MPTAPAPFACLQAGSLPTAADPAGELPFPHGGVHLRREAALQAPTIQEPVRLGKDAGVQAVTQPLHRRARDEDRTFERIATLAADLVGDGGQEPIVGGDRRAAGVEERKAAGPIGRLEHARCEHACPTSAAC